MLGASLLVNPLLHPGARKQVNLAKQMNKVAANYDWKFIINTGDNFYQCVSARLVVVACCPFGNKSCCLVLRVNRSCERCRCAAGVHCPELCPCELAPTLPGSSLL